MVLVLGYYGFGNLGDEAILAVLCSDLERLGIERQEIWVISGDPDKTKGQHGTSAVGRFQLGRIWQLLKQSRCLIVGGGSLLQDVTSKRSIPYYLGLVELAFLHKVPVAMYGQGLGPVESRLFRQWVKRSFRKSAAFTVRDGASAKFLKDLGIAVGDVNVSSDPVFQKTGINRTAEEAKTLMLNLRPYPLWSGQVDLWLDLLEQWQKMGYTLKYLPLGPGDLEMGDTLRKRLAFLEILQHPVLEDMGEAFKDVDLFVSMRLHGIIFSVLQDVVPLGLNYDPKVLAISEQLGVPCWNLTDLPNLSLGVAETIENLVHYKLAYGKALVDLQGRSKENSRMLAQILQLR